MKNCGKILSDIIEARGLLSKDLANVMGIHPQNIRRIFERESIDSAKLEKACEWLKLDPADFFDYRPNGRNNQYNDIDQSVVIGSAQVTVSEPEPIYASGMLAKLFASYEARIKTLEEINSMLMSLLAKKE